MNFFHVMRALREVEFDGMVMPDHVPKHDAEGSSAQAFAFAYGHIIGILQALKDEADNG